MQDMFVNRLTKFFSGNTKHQRFTQNDAVSLSTFVDDTGEVSFYVFLSYTISHRKYRREFCLAFKLLYDICNNYKPSLVYIVIWMKICISIVSQNWLLQSPLVQKWELNHKPSLNNLVQPLKMTCYDEKYRGC